MFSGNAAALLRNNICKCTQYRWIVKNAPAIRKEPYITTIHNYTNKVEVQLASIAFPGRGSKQYLKDWSSFSKELLDDHDFGNKIDVSGNVEDQAKLITKGMTSSFYKMKAIYDWVAKSIVWTGNERIFADKDVDDVLESKKGSNAEITFLILSMLKSVGVDGYPVILSTRDNGVIQDLYPILDQFNYILAAAKIGSKYYYLDATDPLRPMELLPAKVLGVRGLILKKGKPDWVNFSSTQRKSLASVTNININGEGSVKGTVENQYSSYAALFVRDNLADKDEKDVVKDLFDVEKSGFAIDSSNVTYKDSLENPLNIKINISSPDYAQVNGDIIYINPFVVNRIEENPFKAAVRKFPVDYGYKRSLTSVINLQIPEGYKVKENIEDHKYALGQNYVVYSQHAIVDGNKIQIITKTDINNPKVEAKNYKNLRNLYGQIVSAQSEQIVIEKTNNLESAAKNTDNGKISKKKGRK